MIDIHRALCGDWIGAIKENCDREIARLYLNGFVAVHECFSKGRQIGL